MDPAFYITAFATLFVIIDPIGLAPLFATTHDLIAMARRARVSIPCVRAAKRGARPIGSMIT
ncbi:MAG: hypothetical protein AAFR53_17280, partial [Pseudomonadota bacterium]